jgi:hypothetical protein
MSSRIILLFAISISQVLLTAGCRDREPVEFVRSGLSDAWPTFTSGEEGFEIKYPPDWRCAHSPRVGMVNFSGGSGNVNVRRFDEATRKQMEGLYPEQNPFASNGRAVRIGDLVGRSAVPGNGYIDSVIIERGSFTYEIIWRRTSAAVGEEMAATFRFIDVKHSDYLSYTDQVCGIAFDYPYNWSLDSGGTDGSVRISGDGFSVDIDFKADTTVEDFLRLGEHQTADVEELKEHFRHHLVGYRCRWLGRETYVLKNNQGGAFRLMIEKNSTGPVSRKSLDDFLDSLRL